MLSGCILEHSASESESYHTNAFALIQVQAFRGVGPGLAMELISRCGLSPTMVLPAFLQSFKVSRNSMFVIIHGVEVGSVLDVVRRMWLKWQTMNGIPCTMCGLIGSKFWKIRLSSRASLGFFILYYISALEVSYLFVFSITWASMHNFSKTDLLCAIRLWFVPCVRNSW